MTVDKRKKAKDGEEYSAKQIQVLEGLEGVRRRPGMYIGSTSATGLHHLVWEVVDNSVDEAMAGHCDRIIVTLLPDNVVSCEDNGRGIPGDIHKQFGVSALELVLTKLHAGGKFGGGGYKVSGGLHGVGVSVVNALSTYMKAEVKRDGKLWEQEYKQGVPQHKVKAVGGARGTGTIITFQADKTIFETLDYDWNTIRFSTSIRKPRASAWRRLSSMSTTIARTSTLSPTTSTIRTAACMSSVSAPPSPAFSPRTPATRDI